MDKKILELNKEDLLKNLESVEGQFKKFLIDMVNANNGLICNIDLFFFSAIQRSLYLVLGFSGLIKDKNYFAAAPLIRLSIDNLLHIYAMFIVDDPNGLAVNLMRGKKRLKDYKDRNQYNMTDTYLVKKFFEDHENSEFLSLKEVYKETSKFIHFSDKHMFSLVQSMNNKSMNLQLLSKTFDNIPEREEKNSIIAMIEIIRAQLKYVIGWVKTKEMHANKK